MTLRQWNAVIMLTAQVLIGTWVVVDLARTPSLLDGTMSMVSSKMIWAIVFSIGFTIVANIIVGIAGHVLTHEDMQNAPADERDELIDLKAKRLAYFVVTTGAGLFLLALALGMSPVMCVYALFGAVILTEIVHSSSVLYLYLVD